MKRANLLARLVIGGNCLPGWALPFARLESRPLLKGILGGGLHDPRRLPDHYLGELRRVGRRPGYPVVARAIYRNMESLIAARERYARINVPVTLVYGDEDWSRPSDRQANIESVPGARDILLRNKGYFTALEAPDDVARILLDDARLGGLGDECCAGRAGIRVRGGSGGPADPTISVRGRDLRADSGGFP